MPKLQSSLRKAGRQPGTALRKQPSRDLQRPQAFYELSAGTVGKVVVLVGVVVAASQLVRAINQPPRSSGRPEIFTAEVVAEYPHDPKAFTQGLQFDRLCLDNSPCIDVFWESTGLYGESTVRQVALQTGEVLRSTNLHRSYFGEGLVKLGDRIYQLTWVTPTVLIYDTKLNQLGTAKTHLRDGWGLTTDGTHLIISDGSSQIHWLDPQTMKLQRSITVRDEGKEVTWLNELEMIEGEIWANVWQTECIARIDPATGNVRSWLMLHGMRDKLALRNLPGAQGLDVLNGIAYDAQGRRLFITGKKWPRIFEVVLKKEPEGQPGSSQARSCAANMHGFM